MSVNPRQVRPDAPLDYAGLPEAACRRHLALVTPYYREKFRDYHDLRHPIEMLACAAAKNIRLDAAQVVAILFHDIVNVPGVSASVNEVASAGLMRVLLADDDEISPEVLERATEMVLATDHRNPPANEAVAVVLDLDLARLALPWPEFCRHSQSVHAEWRHLVPDYGVFMQGRAAFFRGFLTRPRIFFTGLFDEVLARDNLERLIAEWGGNGEAKLD